MVAENPTCSGPSLDRKALSTDRLDPLSNSIRVVLVVYLLPVIALVTVVGLVGIAIEWAARFLAKTFGPPHPTLPRIKLALSKQRDPVIGSRPITRQARASRHRVPR